MQNISRYEQIVCVIKQVWGVLEEIIFSGIFSRVNVVVFFCMMGDHARAGRRLWGVEPNREILSLCVREVGYCIQIW